MTQRVLSMAIVIALTAAVGSAGATTINTPPLSSDNPTSPGDYRTVDCIVTNGSDVPITVTFTFFDVAGAIVSGPVPVAVDANQAVGPSAVIYYPNENRTFCRVEGKFSKKKVTVTLKNDSAAVTAR